MHFLPSEKHCNLRFNQASPIKITYPFVPIEQFSTGNAQINCGKNPCLLVALSFSKNKPAAVLAQKKEYFVPLVSFPKNFIHRKGASQKKKRAAPTAHDQTLKENLLLFLTDSQKFRESHKRIAFFHKSLDHNR